MYSERSVRRRDQCPAGAACPWLASGPTTPRARRVSAASPILTATGLRERQSRWTGRLEGRTPSETIVRLLLKAMSHGPSTEIAAQGLTLSRLVGAAYRYASCSITAPWAVLYPPLRQRSRSGPEARAQSPAWPFERICRAPAARLRYTGPMRIAECGVRNGTRAPHRSSSPRSGFGVRATAPPEAGVAALVSRGAGMTSLAYDRPQCVQRRVHP